MTNNTRAYLFSKSQGHVYANQCHCLVTKLHNSVLCMRLSNLLSKCFIDDDCSIRSKSSGSLCVIARADWTRDSLQASNALKIAINANTIINNLIHVELINGS